MRKLFILIFVFAARMGLSEAHGDEKDHGKKPAGQEHSAAEAKEEHHDEKSHDEGKEHAEGKGHEEGKEHEEAGHKHEGEEGEEESSQVGPDKGILEANEKEGIKLSPEAEKNFDISKSKVTNASSIELPKSAIVTAGTEINLFRLRKGFYKRVDFNLISKGANSIVVKSTELVAGDEIVTAGMNFIRLAELAAFGGAAEGHSH